MLKIARRTKIYVVTAQKTIKLTNVQQINRDATHAKPLIKQAGTAPAPHTSRKLTNLILETQTTYFNIIQQQTHGLGPKAINPPPTKTQM